MAFKIARISTARQDASRGGNAIASVYRASFTQVLIGCLYSIALPNVLIFKLHMSPVFLGILGAIGAFAYIAGPIVFKKWWSGAGARRSLINIVILDSAMMGITIAFLSPVILIISSMLEGLLASMYWTNMNALVSGWQACVPRSKQSAIFKKYGMSWNLGGIAGEIGGFLVILAGLDDYIVMVISLGLEAVHFSFLLGIVSPDLGIKNAKMPGTRDNSRIANKRYSHAIRYMFTLIVLMIMGELCLQVIKSTYDFLFPFIVLKNEDSSGVVYAMSLFQQIAQMGGIYVSSKLDERGQYRGAVVAIAMTLVITSLVLVAPAMLVISSALIIVGFAGGLIYGFSAQIMLRCNKGITMRFASLYETFSGIGEGIMVLATGFTSETGYSTAFMVLEWYLAATLVVFVAVLTGIPRASKKIIKVAWLGHIMRGAVVLGQASIMGAYYPTPRAYSSANMLALASRQPPEPRQQLVLSPESMHL
ncbi:MAG TPA: MFS transporter [Candidatus Lokiarchaeia archaeon]|nr:MFS transporter [Candidatus Lokiarchaeia archaeon]